MADSEHNQQLSHDMGISQSTLTKIGCCYLSFQRRDALESKGENYRHEAGTGA